MNRTFKLPILIALILFGPLIVSNSFFVVQPTEMAATRWLGGTVMQTEPLKAGLHFKVPFLEKVDRLQTSVSAFDLPELRVYTIDNQGVTLAIHVQFQVPASSVLNLLYGVGHTGNVDLDSMILPVVRDKALAGFAKYNTIVISEKREEIAMEMQKEISGGLEKLFGINVISVQLTSVTYSEVFVKSVEAATKAKADAVQSENSVVTKRHDGEQVIVTAKAAAEAEIARATGIAQSNLITANAEAKAIETIGRALQDNPRYVNYLQIKQWNGKMPRFVGNSSMYPMINLDNK